MSRRGLPTGVQRKHSRSCPQFTDKAARCRGKGCSYQVQAGPRGARQTKTVATLDEALAWKRDVDAAKAAGRLSSSRAPTLREATERWLVDAEAGVALARGRKPFKPGTLQGYRRNLEVDLLPDYGAVRLDHLADSLDAIVADLQRSGKAASTVRNVVMPLRAVCRHAVKQKWISVNPTTGLEVPAGAGRRTNVVAPQAIAPYLAALDQKDRPLWATAFYAGLRRGELQALRWSAVDLARGLIVIDPEQGNYDQRTGTTHGPKSEAGARRVPISGGLRSYLLEHRARAGARPAGLVFARGALGGTCRVAAAAQPFNDSTTGNRANKAWLTAGLAPVGLHDCRHTFASLMIAAQARRGVFDPKLLQKIMGHSSIQVTYDRYGHLFPGAEDEVGVMLDELMADEPGASEAAEAWSRLREVLRVATLRDALPVVTEALQVLSSWQQAVEDRGPLPFAGRDGPDGPERAGSVQRTTDGGDPR